MRHSSTAKATFYLTLGEWFPDDCSRVLGLTPTRIRRAGEPVREGLPPSLVNEWALDSGWVETDRVDTVLAAFLERLSSKVREIRAFCDAHGAHCGVVVCVRVYDEPPVLDAGRDAIRHLATLGAEFSLDISDKRLDS